MEAITFPYHFQLSDYSFVCDICPAHRYGEIADIFEESSQSSDGGVGTDEFPTRDILMDRIKTSEKVFIATDMKTGAIAMVYPIYPSPVMRSEKPVYHAGYGISTPKYRRLGLAVVVMTLTSVIGWQLGYYGFLGRSSIISNNTRLLMKYHNTIFTGIIPHGMSHKNGGLVHDTIGLTAYAPKHDIKVCADILSLPVLTESSSVKPYDEVKFNERQLKTNTESLLLRPGLKDDVATVEAMIRQAASRGHGFALDEFTSQGHFNRFYFSKCHLAVVVDQSDIIVAAALFGMSRLARTEISKISHLYIVMKERQMQSIEETIVREMCGVIRDTGYLKIMTDLFTHESATIHLYEKCGFRIIGSIPENAYVYGQGLCTSVIMEETNNSVVDLAGLRSSRL